MSWRGVMASAVIMFVVAAGCGGGSGTTEHSDGGHQLSPLPTTVWPPPLSPTPVPECGEIIFSGVVGGYSIGYRLYCIDADGSEPRVMTSKGYEWDYPYPTYESAPTWSPDGSTLLYISEAAEAMCTVDHKGRGVRQIASGQITRAIWSPDGSKIAYARYELSNPDDQWSPVISEIAIVDRDGKQVLPLTRRLMHVEDLAWSPDGGLLAYGWSAEFGRMDAVNVLDLNTLGDYPLVADGVASMGIWSSDGESFIYHQPEDIETNSGNEFRSVTRDGATNRLLVATTIPRIYDLTFSPDGAWIAFSGGKESGIYLVRPDGTELHPLPGGGVDVYNPTWSPDGTHLLIWKITGSAWIDFIPDAVTELQLVNVSGGQMRVLVTDIMGWNSLPAAAWRPGAR